MSHVLLVAFGAIIGLLFNPTPSQEFGAALPQTPAGFETSLAAPITSSATTMTLAANSTRGGNVLSGYNCFTIDAGSAQAEYVCGTVSGTTVASMTRGIDDLTGTTTNATLQFSHRRGASVQVTDFPAIQIIRSQLNGSDTIPNLLNYANTVLIEAGSPTTTVATKFYVDSVAVAGASNADTTTKGISEEATAAEAAASTQNGGTGARLFLPASLATTTPTAGCTTFCVVGAVSGKIAQSFFNLTQHFAFTSLFATNASSTNATTTNLYVSGTASNIFPVATSTTFTSSGTWVRPTGVNKVKVRVVGGGGAGGAGAASVAGAGGGGAGAYCEAIVTVTGNVTVTVGAAGSASSFAGAVTVTAAAGTAGTAGSNGANVDGGAGGSCTNADILSITGGTGRRGQGTPGDGGRHGGDGAGSPLGDGGRGAITDGGAGGAATGYGAGGGGGNGNGGTGGAGAPGIVTIEWMQTTPY